VRRAVFACAFVAALALPARAGAALDPGRAQNDVQETIREKAYPFCSAPHQPLSLRARELCPSANEIPSCEGFAAACSAANESPRVPRFGGSATALGAFLRTLAQALVWLLVAALLLAVLVPIVRALGRLKREDKDEPEPREKARSSQAVLPPEALSDEETILRRASELAARGENAAALELYLAASLRALDKRGAVRLAAHRTNGEYVRACADANAKPALRDIAREVDRVKFGGAAAAPEAVARAAQLALWIVRSLPVGLLGIAIALCMGCGGGPARVRHAGDDPAGLELLPEVLRRQGVHVEPLGSSLASMPLPGPEETSPAVVVDLERTPLDDDTSEHLVAWVDAGGVLVLAGSPADWPAAFGVSPASPKGHKVTARALITRGGSDDEDEASHESGPVYAHEERHGELTTNLGLTFREPVERAAWFEDDVTYSAVLAHGRGYVLGIATDELFTNAGLARPGNAPTTVAVLSNTGRQSFAIAEPDDGVAPPSTPLAAMLHAGLGPALGHAVLAALLLFLAAGVRLAHPKPTPPPLRRAFVEHVEAVGALYARTRSAPHALATYARFADDRLRARLPRQTGDIAGFLASRARVPLEKCQRVWARATAARGGARPQGDELAVLAELAALYSAATGRDTDT
jgi:hypothetical protein